MKQKIQLARTLILNERFDLALYERLSKSATGPLARVLAELIEVEQAHVKQWQTFFKQTHERLDLIRRIKLEFIILFCRIFRTPFLHLVMEATEVHGINKYLKLWNASDDPAFRKAVFEIARDEIGHEAKIVEEFSQKKISPETIRNAFLGFNDGSVEILGAVSGFSAAFANPLSVAVAGTLVGFAGTLSMAVGIFMAAGSEREVETLERWKDEFLHGAKPGSLKLHSKMTPLASASVVGLFYLLGATLPVLPFFLGAKTVILSVIVSSVLILVVSLALAFLSGMDMKKRALHNAAAVAGTVLVTYSIGLLTKNVFGITL